ncbi:hypothetical protein JNW91_18875 [Micromonospora sp. STR1_7]|uniref:DUF222 domain-containing protein n=1 Tax=Micromonospora parastrephiae TaxID=2806101 RepID=A0ABS1XWW1_9ACTN|nr:hypothetical protein [Micromonospora parastrephiae]MBM0233733.1 hypothetical protein [Micromonospora parastrephiae]
MADNEIAEFHQRATSAVTAAIQAAGQLAQVLIDARIAQLQRAARVSEEQARQIRAQARAAQQADAALWRPATRPAWWRQASPDDIARAWRASSGWAAVDPRARRAQQVIAERLAERGVRVDPDAGGRPENAAWLSDQLDRAAVDDVPESRRDPADGRADPEDGGRRRTARQRQEEMAIHVRAVWSTERAERVIGSQAWPALAYKLDQLEQAGHDVRDLLRQVPGFVDRAHTPAAYAFRVVDDYAADVDQTAGHQGEAGSQPAPERGSVTLEGEWRDTGGAAEDHAASEGGSDARAAHLAAQGFPSSTRSAVAAAAASPAVDAQQRPAGPGAQAAPEAASGR